MSRARWQRKGAAAPWVLQGHRQADRLAEASHSYAQQKALTLKHWRSWASRKLRITINSAFLVRFRKHNTSKWNKIEHRMFCHITANWRGRPLETREVIVNLIANTHTSKGLTIQADLNVNSYPKGIKISDEEMARLNITPADFHGEWNYSLSPRVSSA